MPSASEQWLFNITWIRSTSFRDVLPVDRRMFFLPNVESPQEWSLLRIMRSFFTILPAPASRRPNHRASARGYANAVYSLNMQPTLPHSRCCCCRPHSTNVLPAESSTRIMWQPTVSPPRWQGKAPLCRDSSRGPG